MNYLEELNTPQREATTCTEGPVMVIAGAGSGKTRVLTFRIAYLLQKGVDPFNILALTFTNKAAKEMKERIGSIVGASDAKSLWMGTFHSVFAKILRFEADKIGYPSNFTIYDTDDSRSLIKSIVREMDLDEKIYKPAAVLGRISNAKNNLISAKEYNANSDFLSEDKAAGKPRLGEIFTAYQQRAFRAGAMDFDDLLFNTNILLRDFPEVLHKYQEKFRYILVDEYQDTNYAQYLIVKKLAARFENICVVGDDAQSIYAFRGANIQNILNFQKDYPDVKTFKLEQNYRSTQNIVNAANSIIWKNKGQIKKEVWTQNEAGEKVRLLRSPSDNEEGMQVARTIYDIRLNQQAVNHDFAILYRTNAQSRSMEEALRKLNIPYKIYGGLSFYKRKEIKDLLAYFRLAVNPNDEEALKRIINYPARGIGQASIDKLVTAAANSDAGLWQALVNPSFQNGITTGVRNKIHEFASMIQSFTAMLTSDNAYVLGSHIAASSGLLRELHNDKSPEGVSRYENIQELLNGLKEFSALQAEEGNPVTLDVYMQDIALLTGDENEKTDEKETVSLMTIHSAKGLEFPFVFIVGLEENLFPSQMSLFSREDLEEERRLFYVAVTRAKKQAFLSYAISRYRWGNLISCEPSRFIEEVDPAFMEMPPPTPAEKMFDIHGFGEEQTTIRRMPSGSGISKAAPRPAPVQPKNLTKIDDRIIKRPAGEEVPRLEPGMQVYHERFGNGVVERLEGQYPEQKATVNFEGSGVKQLLLKFARIKVLN